MSKNISNFKSNFSVENKIMSKITIYAVELRTALGAKSPNKEDY